MNVELAKEKKLSNSLKMIFTLPIISWALYDFANTIFSSNIITIFFPFYLQEVVGSNEVLNQIASTFISYANAIASFLLVVFTPLYGVLIDRKAQKKKYIVTFTLITVIATVLMGIIARFPTENTFLQVPLHLLFVVLLFIIAKFFYHSSLVFYDSMISNVGQGKNISLVSGFGVAVGYVGTLVGLTVYLYVGNEDYHRAFIPSALLFFLFALPLFFFVKEQNASIKPKPFSFFAGYKEIIVTFKEMKQYRSIFTFMVAYFFLNDAIATTIAMMAIYAKTIVGFSSGQFILLYLFSTVSSIIGSFLFGIISSKKGPYRSVHYVGLLLVIALIMGTISTAEWQFWVAGSLFGVALGAMWVTSRALIVELTPEEKRGQFFGLFAFSGKISAIIGPLIYGSITLVFASYGNIASRLALSSLLIMALIGLWVHRFVKRGATE
jgi:MFS transporter, UMF1 family